MVNNLSDRGAIFVEELDEVPEGATVVTKVHHEAKRFASEGYSILLIGHEGHEEVEGTAGEAPDHITLVQTGLLW